LSSPVPKAKRSTNSRLPSSLWVILCGSLLLFQNCSGFSALVTTSAAQSDQPTNVPDINHAFIANGNPAIDNLNRLLAKPDSALDYLIQDVCVNAAGVVIPGDPASCPTHRNVRIGERVPYLVTDRDTANANQTYQALFSYPVPAYDGTLKVLVSKNMQGAFNENFSFNFDEDRDGFDLLDASGLYISGIRTSDGGCLDQIISRDTSQRSGGWIFFATDLGGGELNHQIRIERLNANPPAACRQANTDKSGNYQSVSQTTAPTAHDVWNPPTNWTYVSGKNLRSLITYHYANYQLAQVNNALERFFFTREYGFTRWEAWVPLARCQNEHGAGSSICQPASADNFLKGRCEASTATSVWGNQTWVRIDCRDSTNYIPLKTPVLPLDTKMGQSHGQVDIDSGAVFGL
jgi:hypothetical protein